MIKLSGFRTLSVCFHDTFFFTYCACTKFRIISVWYCRILSTESVRLSFIYGLKSLLFLWLVPFGHSRTVKGDKWDSVSLSASITITFWSINEHVRSLFIIFWSEVYEVHHTQVEYWNYWVEQELKAPSINGKRLESTILPSPVELWPYFEEC